jgi:hypothetical protein
LLTKAGKQTDVMAAQVAAHSPRAKTAKQRAEQAEMREEVTEVKVVPQLQRGYVPLHAAAAVGEVSILH